MPVVRSAATREGETRRLLPIACLLLALAGLTPAARGAAAWFDAAWQFRRPIDMPGEADKPPDKAFERVPDEALCQVEFYTAGHAKPNGEDVRVATDEGRVVPSRVLMAGPGDRVTLVFQPVKGVRKYYAFFGNPNPPPPPKNADDVNYRGGLAMETRVFTGGGAEDFQQCDQCWGRAKEAVGAMMIPNLFLGMNPFDERQQVISRIKGTLYVPAEGSYQFAGAANHKGALYLDGKPILFIPGWTGEQRFHAAAPLTKGKHELVFLAVTGGGDHAFSLAWKKPGTAQAEIIPKEAFGVLLAGAVGPLEERGKTLTADFAAEYLGECFYAGHYSHRYRFSAALAPAMARNPGLKVDWDLGDGQTTSGPAVSHVYLADGVYPLKMRVGIGANSDTQTTRLRVQRNRPTILKPPTDEPPIQSSIVAGYELRKLPAEHLPWATILHARAKAIEPMLAAATRLAGEPGENPEADLTALQEASDEAIARERPADAVRLWEAVPRNSHLQPRAAVIESSLLLWRTGEFARAVALLGPFAAAPGAPPKLVREYGQAMVLGGKAEQGKKLLLSLPNEGPPEQQAARSGAMARTVEYYIAEGDWEHGEEEWDRWQGRYPSDFLEGYSVVLKTRLMEVKKVPAAAAKVAEAFALAVPKSSYAPQLLDRASKLLAPTDPAKGKALRELLKQKYPEDPLAQDK